MKIAINMRRLPEQAASDTDHAEQCFAEFEVHEGERSGVGPQATSEAQDGDSSDTVQVTVVLKGRRDELQNPALSVTQLVLGALGGQARPADASSTDDVVDAPGFAVAS